MDVLGANLLIVHRDQIPVIAAHVPFLVVVGTSPKFVTAILARCIAFFRCMPSATWSVVAVDAGKLFWGFVTALILRVHAQLLVHIIHILWGSKVLQDIGNVVVTVSTCIWATTS